MSAHTPGPWRTVRRANSSWSIYGAGTRASICNVKPIDAERQEANATLIASAPDLLVERSALRSQVATLREALNLIATQCCANVEATNLSKVCLASRTARAALASTEVPWGAHPSKTLRESPVNVATLNRDPQS